MSDPGNDPFACSLCGCYLNERDRIAGEDYCRDCRTESAGRTQLRDGESREGRGGVRPVPPHVDPTPDKGDAG